MTNSPKCLREKMGAAALPRKSGSKRRKVFSKDSLKIVDLPARHLTSPTCCHSLPTTNRKLSFASTAGTLGGGTDRDVQRAAATVTPASHQWLVGDDTPVRIP
ncbi:hypothetical protein AV530_001016 [Patagioenas fasciata monilis]|uniref:Uncharacterized protein n=1 Tax=Patagioenas fasciata monilis TaxID=372326 RepID=A0A1V4KUK2_PATFA|nr:hypothetical protein AV530_001016 [Patagioenas fasciata monilis]